MADGTRASGVPKGFNVGRAPGTCSWWPQGGEQRETALRKSFSYQVTRSLGTTYSKATRIEAISPRQGAGTCNRQSSWCGDCAPTRRASLRASLHHCHHRPAGSRAGEEGGPSPPGGTSTPCSSSSTKHNCLLPTEPSPGTNSPKLLPFHLREGEKRGRSCPKGFREDGSSQQEQGVVTSPRTDTARSPLPAPCPRTTRLPWAKRWQAAIPDPWDQHPVSCPCKDLCPSSRAELFLLSPGWIECPQLRGTGWSPREGHREGRHPKPSGSLKAKQPLAVEMKCLLQPSRDTGAGGTRLRSKRCLRDGELPCARGRPLLAFYMV